MARVFISYARKDLATAEPLRDALIEAGFDAYLDVHDIAPGEPWQDRLGALIATAEKLVFLISPDSVASKYCDWEVNEAERQGKTVLPVVIRETPNDAIPPRLSRLNFLFLRYGSEWEAALPALIEAIEVDLAWEREKTRTNELVEAWERSGRRHSFLLTRDEAIREAEIWRDGHPPAAPAPTATQLAFISESRSQFVRRQRRVRAALASVALVTTLAAAAATYFGLQAERQRAQTAAERDRALITQTRFLADLAMQPPSRGATGMLLSLAGLPDKTEGPAGMEAGRPLVGAAERALYANRLEVRERVVIGGGPIVAMAVLSPAGDRLASGASDGTVRIWDVENGAEIATLRGHASEITALAFSRDGSRLASASTDQTARVWNTRTGEAITEFFGHERRIETADLSPDGRTLVTGSQDGTATLWDVDNGEGVASIRFGGTFNSEFTTVLKVVFSPDGQRLLTGVSSGEVTLWRRSQASEGGWEGVAALEEQGPLGTRRTHLIAAFSPDGRRLVTGFSSDAARLWDTETGAEVAVLPGHGDAVSSAAFSADGALLVTGAFSGELMLWNADDGGARGVLRGHVGAAKSVAFSADGRRLASASVDATARVWNPADGEQIAILRGHDGVLNTVAFRPDAAQLVTTSFDGTARVWDMNENRSDGATAMLAQSAKDVSAIALSPDWSRIAIGGPDGSVRLADRSAESETPLPRRHKQAIERMVFSPDGRRLASHSKDGEAVLWSVPQGDEIASLGVVQDDRLTINFSPDGRRLAVASSWDDEARLLDAATGAEIALLDGHAGHVFTASFSPDGRRLVTRSLNQITHPLDGGALLAAPEIDGAPVPPPPEEPSDVSTLATALLWRAEDGAPIARVAPAAAAGEHDGEGAGGGWTTAHAFSPDGLRLATGFSDGSVRLWDAVSGAPIATLGALNARVWAIAFSPDGALLAAGSNPTAYALGPTNELIPVAAALAGSIKVWNAQTGTEIAAIRGFEDGISHLAFSPDGGAMAVALGDKSVRLVSRAGDGWRESAALRGHRSFVKDIVFSPDGRRIATGASQGFTVRLWDSKSGMELATLVDNDGGVRPVAFSADGSRLATISEKNVGLWSVFQSTQAFVDRAKAQAPRCLTPAQRRQFFLQPEPPRWCVTGAGLEGEPDPAKWRPKWPYRTSEWRDWLSARDRGERPPLPEKSEARGDT